MDHPPASTELVPVHTSITNERDFIVSFKLATRDRPKCCCGVYPLLQGTYIIIMIVVLFNTVLLVLSAVFIPDNFLLALLSTILIFCMSTILHRTFVSILFVIKK